MQIFFILVCSLIPFIKGKTFLGKDISSKKLPSAYPCDYNKYTLGLSTFITQSKIQGQDLSTNGENLQKGIEGVITGAYTTNQSSTKDAFYTLCNAQANFYGQLGFSNVVGCINVLSLVQHNYSIPDAYLFEQIFSSLDYQCSSGFRINMDHINDYAFTLINSNTVIESIYNNFNSSINLPSSNDVKKCEALKKYHDNMGKLFGGSSNSSEFGYSICEQSAIYMLVKLPQCYSPVYDCNFMDF
uniref:DUF725 domain-containing protein n=1 Tax=Parastrongyloides trichosuri TaxID=131310 RepID=A0A0N4ZQW7_PARTI